MTMLLVGLIAVVLGLAAAIHLFWVAGGLWPCSDEQSLARMVIGIKGIRNMPARWLTALVALGIALTAIWPILWLGWIASPLPHWLDTTGMVVLCLVLLGRGFGGYSPAMKRLNCEEPFVTLNARYFSPIIILLGAAFAYLLSTNPWWI